MSRRRRAYTPGGDLPPLHLCQTFAPKLTEEERSRSKSATNAFVLPAVYPDEPYTSRKWRTEALNTVWNEYESAVSSELEALNLQTFRGVSSFCENMFEQMEIEAADSSEKPSMRREIPVAGILAGVNVPDHNAVFGLLATHIINECEDSHVVVLNARACSNIVNAIHTLVKRFIEPFFNEVQTKDEMEEQRKRRKKKSGRSKSRGGRIRRRESDDDSDPNFSDVEDMEHKAARSSARKPKRRMKVTVSLEDGGSSDEDYVNDGLDMDDDVVSRGEKRGWGANGVKLGYQKDDEEEEEDEDMNGRGKSLFVKLMARDCSLSTLHSWATAPKSQNGGAINGHSARLVLVLPDIETFAGHVLHDLIGMLSHYLQRGLNIVLVLGLATSHEALYRLLPRSVLSMLQTERFSLQPPMQVLETLITTVSLNFALPILTESVTNVLVDHFLFNSFSSLAFVRGVHLALLDYFSMNPLSYLCAEGNDAYVDLDRSVFNVFGVGVHANRTVPKNDIDIVATIDSGIDGEVTVTSGTLLTLAKTIGERKREWAWALKVLSEIGGSLPTPFRIVGRHLLQQSMTPEYRGSSAYQSLLNYFGCTHTNIDVLISILKKWEKLVSSNSVESGAAELEPWRTTTTSDGTESQRNRKQSAVVMLKSVCEALEKIKDGEGEDAAKQKLHEADKGAYNASVSTSISQSWGVKKKRKAAIAMLASNGNPDKLPMALKKGTDTTIPSSILLRLKEFVGFWFKMFLDPLWESPGVNLFTYKETSRLKESFLPQPRLTLQLALTDPAQLISITDADTGGGGGEVKVAVPDAGVAYRLLEGFGRVVNVRRWLDAFTTEIERMEVDVDESGTWGDEGVDEIEEIEEVIVEEVEEGEEGEEVEEIVVFEEVEVEEDEDEERRGKKKIRKERAKAARLKVEERRRRIQARFIRATMELQRLGLVKENQHGRKVDHATRLAFGTL